MAQPTFNIRPGQAEDVPDLLSMIKELAEYEKALSEVENTEAQLLADGFGDSPLYEFFIAEVDQQAVGIALFFYRYSTWKGKTLFVEDIYVRPAFRGRQIGKAFFKTLAQKAHAENCRRMFWQVLDWNESAINFYKQLGADFDAEWTNVSLNLEQFRKIMD